MKEPRQKIYSFTSLDSNKVPTTIIPDVEEVIANTLMRNTDALIKTKAQITAERIAGFDTDSPIITYDPTKIKPLNYDVLVELDVQEMKTASGISVPHAFNPNNPVGIIVRVDEDMYTNEQISPSLRQLKAGDKVLFVPHAKIDIPNVGGTPGKHVLIPLATIKAVYE